MKFMRLFIITMSMVCFSLSIFANNSILEKIIARASQLNTSKQPSHSLYTFALSPNNKEIYAIDYSPISALYIIDNDSGITRKIIPLPSKDNPSYQISGIVFSLDGKKAYISDFSKNIYIVDTAKQEIIGQVSNKPKAPPSFTAPNNIVRSPNGFYLYVADGIIETSSQEGPFIHVVDTRKDTVIAKIKKLNRPNHLPFGWMQAAFAFNHDASLLYISDLLLGKIDILDTRTNTLSEDVIPFDEYLPIIDMALSATEDKLYVLSWGSKVYITNPKTHQLIDKFDIGKETFALALNADDTKLYIVSKQLNAISVVETVKPYKVLKTIAVGEKPQTLRLSADGRELYVGNIGNNTISVIDMVTDTVIRTITVKHFT